MFSSTTCPCPRSCRDGDVLLGELPLRVRVEWVDELNQVFRMHIF
jgi:hypothetical protein